MFCKGGKEVEEEVSKTLKHVVNVFSNFSLYLFKIKILVFNSFVGRFDTPFKLLR